MGDCYSSQEMVDPPVTSVSSENRSGVWFLTVSRHTDSGKGTTPCNEGVSDRPSRCVVEKVLDRSEITIGRV